MTPSPLGDEMDLAGAEFLEYAVGPGGSRNVRPDFESLFPDLAGRPLTVGDTWATHDTTTTGRANLRLVMTTENLNTLGGFEIVEGLACARIRVVVRGTMTGEGEREGVPFRFEGEVDGARTWFFAYEEGCLVRTDSDLKVEGSVDVSGPRSTTMLVAQQMKSELKLVR
jgi:hypothetical protein